MREEPIWLDDTETSAPRQRPHQLMVLALAAVPWVIVAGLVFLPEPSDETVGAPDEATVGAPTSLDGPDAAAASPPSGDRSDDVQTPPSPIQPTAGLAATGGSADVTEVSPPRPGGPTAAGPISAGPGIASDRLRATATAVARAWLTGVAPHLDVPGVEPVASPSYAEHVVVEAVETLSADVVVATVLAVVVQETTEGLHADIRRVGVPLTFIDGAPRPLGQPWWLPSPELATAEPRTEPVDDPTWIAAAEDGLRGGGFHDVDVHELAMTAHGAWRADIEAETGEGRHINGPVWLVRDGTQLSLAGSRSLRPTSTETSTTAPAGPTERAPDAPVDPPTTDQPTEDQP